MTRIATIGSAAFALVLPLLASCQSASSSSGPSRLLPEPWHAGFRPPGLLVTDRVRLEPLAPKHAELDHAAFMSCREYLHRTLHWGAWPRADTTVEDNRRDLERHWNEFQSREAYAYTVLRPDRSAALGCVYLDPIQETAGPAPAASLAWWVIEPEAAAGLEEHLLHSVFEWIRASWPFQSVTVQIHPEHGGGIATAEALGLERRPEAAEGRVVFVWRR